MNHQDALKEMAVEKYLLGELSGASRDSFEEHLFECPECAEDVKAGAILIEGARGELGSAQRVTARPQVETKRRWTSWLTSPWVLAPALAACLLILAVQTFVVQPRMRLELAQAQAPVVLTPLVLANAGARGDSIPELVARAHGSFVVSLDVPTNERYGNYLCSLYSLDGALLWQTTVSREQARDAVLISMPVDKTKEGLNDFLIQGLAEGLPEGGGSSGRLEDLARYRFRIKIQK